MLVLGRSEWVEWGALCVSVFVVGVISLMLIAKKGIASIYPFPFPLSPFPFSLNLTES
jgi:hypothetical protein